MQPDESHDLVKVPKPNVDDDEIMGEEEEVFDAKRESERGKTEVMRPTEI